MHISCPKCEVKFIVSLDQIPPEGRYVRCSKCSHLWHSSHQGLVLFSATPPEKVMRTHTYIQRSGVNLPAIIPNNKSKYIRFFTLTLLLLIFLIGYTLNNYISYYNNLEAEVIRVSRLNDNLALTYKIKCSKGTFFYLPLIRIRLYDKDFQLLNTYILKDFDKTLINSNNVVIKTNLDNVSTKANNVNITIGSNFTLFFK